MKLYFKRYESQVPNNFRRPFNFPAQLFLIPSLGKGLTMELENRGKHEPNSYHKWVSCNRESASSGSMIGIFCCCAEISIRSLLTDVGCWGLFKGRFLAPITTRTLKRMRRSSFHGIGLSIKFPKVQSELLISHEVTFFQLGSLSVLD